MQTGYSRINSSPNQRLHSLYAFVVTEDEGRLARPCARVRGGTLAGGGDGYFHAARWSRVNAAAQAVGDGAAARCRTPGAATTGGCERETRGSPEDVPSLACEAVLGQ
mgnify:CR=1 FL=1